MTRVNRSFLLQPMTLAVAISICVHALFLMVHFTLPIPARARPHDPGLEIILVNARHNTAPVKPNALAQVNLDGGGNAKDGRAQSPLPNMDFMQDGDRLQSAQQRVVELEEQQHQLLVQLKQSASLSTARHSKRDINQATPQAGEAASENSSILARMEAEITRKVQDYNKRPKKTQITPSTRAVGYAAYYKTVQQRIEKLGTLNFPQAEGKKLYGELVVSIPIFQDGSLYQKEGGLRIEKSSGVPALDRAALNIVRDAAPFPPFPADMRTAKRDDVWEVVTRFKFTRDEVLESAFAESEFTETK